MALEKGKAYSAAMVLKEYFGLKEGQNVMGFAEELKTLTDSEKLAMAKDAANQLGVSLK